MAAAVEPQWERGYRSHGYWLAGRRWGWIGLESGGWGDRRVAIGEGART